MKKVSITNSLAIMSIFMVSSTTGAINPALQRMIAAFPNVAVSTIRLAATIPAIAAIIMMFLVGGIAGKIISYRNLAIIGVLLMLVGGLTPLFFTNSIGLIILLRLFFGFGIGCIGIRNAIILRTYEESKKASMVGMGTFTTNVTMIIVTILAGFLADIRWNYTFGVYGLCLVTLLLITFFLKDPGVPTSDADVNTTEEKKKRSKIPGAAILFAIILFFTAMTIYPIMLTMSTFLVMKHLGTAAVAGTVISSFAIGGILIGPIFGKILNIFKKWTVPIFTIIVVFGILLILSGSNLISIYIGTIACGIGYSTVMSAMVTYAGQVSTDTSVAGSSMLILALGQLGLFLSTYYITIAGKIFSFIGSEVEGTYISSIGILVIIALIFVAGKLAPNVKENSTN